MYFSPVTLSTCRSDLLLPSYYPPKWFVNPIRNGQIAVAATSIFSNWNGKITIIHHSQSQLVSSIRAVIVPSHPWSPLIARLHFLHPQSASTRWSSHTMHPTAHFARLIEPHQSPSVSGGWRFEPRPALAHSNGSGIHGLRKDQPRCSSSNPAPKTKKSRVWTFWHQEEPPPKLNLSFSWFLSNRIRVIWELQLVPTRGADLGSHPRVEDD